MIHVAFLGYPARPFLFCLPVPTGTVVPPPVHFSLSLSVLCLDLHTTCATMEPGCFKCPDAARALCPECYKAACESHLMQCQRCRFIRAPVYDFCVDCGLKCKQCQKMVCDICMPPEEQKGMVCNWCPQEKHAKDASPAKAVPKTGHKKACVHKAIRQSTRTRKPPSRFAEC